MEEKLNCDICKGLQKITPAKTENPPGLKSISYRVGTYSQFKESMHAGISLDPNLEHLTFRQDADLALGLVDSWAMVADVISFYQERIANEGFLRTATERKSILELARTIGYEINPGVAANTFLAFVMEDSKNKLQKITIDTGTKAQSIPAQGEKPQTFETIEKIEAKPEWNAVKPLLTKTQLISKETRNLSFKGTNTRLKNGDLLLMCTKSHYGKKYYKIVIMLVTRVLPQPSLQKTIVDVERISKYHKEYVSLQEGVFALRTKSSLFGHNAPFWSKTIFPNTLNWNITTIESFSKKLNKEQNDHVYLDNVYPGILPNDLVVLKYENYFFTFLVSSVDEISLADFAMSTKVTELKLDLPSSESLKFNIHKVTVYAEPEILELSEIDRTESVETNVIELGVPVSDLRKGQLVLITGKRSNVEKPGETVSEIGLIHDVNGAKIILEKNLINSYKRDTVLINFNVARATHGEARQEILGSGDFTKSMQMFALKQKPLTYISSPKGAGSESTLEIRIDDILWHQADNLLDLGPKDRCYITRLDEIGNTSVIFGDGVRGARPNAGIENITARFRSGIGMAGILKENQITMLMNRPLGVRSVINPLPTEGAQDPEDSNVGRRNAPLKTLTMGRIVSLQDFEDYASAFAGIGKAKATWGWSGRNKIVCLTIMSTSGQAISQESELYRNLLKAIKDIKDPQISFQLCGFNKTTFNLRAKILVDPDKEFEKVKLGITTALLEEFSEKLRQFGQDTTSSEIMSAIQNTDGVLAVDIDYLYTSGATLQLHNTLPSQAVRWNNNSILPSDLLTINPNGIEILEMKT